MAKTYTLQELQAMGAKPAPVTAPVKPAGALTLDQLKAMGATEVGATPSIPASFQYKVPEKAVSKEEMLKRIQQYQADAAVSKKEADYAASPLGMAGNFGKAFVGNLASTATSAVELGKSLGAGAATTTLPTYTKNITDLTTSNLYKMKQIKELEDAGKDATNLKKSYNDTVKLIDENRAAINKIKGDLPSTGKLLGQLGGTALDVLTAGTYGTAAKGLKTGALASVKSPVVKSIATAVSPELAQLATQKSGGLLSKSGLANIAKGGTIGYGYDVTQNLQSGKTGAEAFTPSYGTAIGAGIPLISESAKSISQAKNALSNYLAPEAQASRLIKNREKELFNIENSYVKTRKAMDYSKDANAASRNRIASVDIWEKAVGSDGKINTTIPNGAFDQYKKMTIDGKEGVVRDLLKKEGTTIDKTKIAQQLEKNIMNSGLEGKALKSALKNIDDEVAGLMLRADSNGRIPLTALQDAKISTTGGINYMTEPFVKSERKAVARAYKELVENSSISSKPTIKQINEELSKYYKDLELIESLNGRIVKGGKAGKYFAQISGNIIGGAAGSMFGPAATAVGTIVGGEAGSRIKGSILEKTLKGTTGNVAPESAILKAARENADAPRNLPALIRGIKYTPTSGGSKYAPIQLPTRNPFNKVENLINQSKSLGNLKTQYNTTATNTNNSIIKDILPNSPSNFKRAEGLSESDKQIEEAAFQKIRNSEKEILNDYKTKFGKVVNADNFRPVFADVGYKGYNAAAVQEPASYLSKLAFKEALNNKGNYATFTSGGSGAGKSSALEKLNTYKDVVDDSAVVFDSNLSSYDSAVSKIKDAVKAGKDPQIFYVYREPLDAFENGVVKRMKNNTSEMGRLVPSNVIADNHIDSFEVAKRLKEEGVNVYFIDNSLGPNKSKLVTMEDIQNKLSGNNKAELTSMFNKKAKELYENGAINKEEYEGYIKG